MTVPYYSDDLVQLYHGDCREITEWLAADVLVTDPPYGRAWEGHSMKNSAGYQARRIRPRRIEGDRDTEARDRAMELWGDRLGVVFGDPLIAPPAGAVQACPYVKSSDAGIAGARAGLRRDLELIYLTGPWPTGLGGRSSVFRSDGMVAGPRGIATRAGHSHAKPLDVLEQLIDLCPPGSLADPFAGSGSTLVAAKMLGRKAIGVEIEERYCEIAARRLLQDALPFEATS